MKPNNKQHKGQQFWAVDIRRKLKHISEVSGGEACLCTCYFCGGRMIAKKGNTVIHHFAHKDNNECAYSLKEVLRAAAYEILASHSKIKFPPLFIGYNNQVNLKPMEEGWTYRFNHLLYEAVWWCYNYIEIGQYLLDFLPDVIMSGKDKKLGVEIIMDFPTDTEKINKYEENGLSAVEINLAGMHPNIKKKELTYLVIEEVMNRKWLCNNFAKNIRDRIESVSETKKIIRQLNYIENEYNGMVYLENIYTIPDCFVCQKNTADKRTTNFNKECVNKCEFFIGIKCCKDRVLHGSKNHEWYEEIKCLFPKYAMKSFKGEYILDTVKLFKDINLKIENQVQPKERISKTYQYDFYDYNNNMDCKLECGLCGDSGVFAGPNSKIYHCEFRNEQH